MYTTYRDEIHRNYVQIITGIQFSGPMSIYRSGYEKGDFDRWKITMKLLVCSKYC